MPPTPASRHWGGTLSLGQQDAAQAVCECKLRVSRRRGWIDTTSMMTIVRSYSTDDTAGEDHLSCMSAPAGTSVHPRPGQPATDGYVHVHVHVHVHARVCMYGQSVCVGGGGGGPAPTPAPVPLCPPLSEVSGSRASVASWG